MAGLLVPHEPASAAIVRHALLEDLSAHEVSDASCDEVILVASELVGNAVSHTPPTDDGQLTVAWDIAADSVTFRVFDASTRTPRPRNAPADEPHGRGLAIVADLAQEWGYERHRDGKHVWARVPLRCMPSGDRRHSVAS